MGDLDQVLGRENLDRVEADLDRVVVLVDVPPPEPRIGILRIRPADQAHRRIRHAGDDDGTVRPDDLGVVGLAGAVQKTLAQGILLSLSVLPDVVLQKLALC